MSKTTLLFTLAILVIGFLYWFDQTTEILELMRPAQSAVVQRKVAAQNPDRNESPLPSLREISDIDSNLSPKRTAVSGNSTENSEPAATSQPAQPSSENPSRPNPTATHLTPERRQQLFEEVSTLEQELEEAQSELLVRRGLLDSLKQQQDQQRTLSGSSTEQQIAANQVQIENLATLLESNQEAENNIQRRAEAALTIQSDAARAQRDQLDSQIQNLQQGIQQTEKEIQSWTHNLYDLTARDVRLAELRAQLTNQTQTLQSLREQRTQISSNTLDQSQTVYSAAITEQETLADNQVEIQQEMVTRRAEIQRLQTTQNEAQKNLETLESRIAQAQKNHDEQMERVRQIEENLRNRRQQLRPG